MACEDYPCCEHELGDCEGRKYGSDESIKAEVLEAWNTGHGYCDHEAGLFMCDDEDDDEDDEDDDEDESDFELTMDTTAREQWDGQFEGYGACGVKGCVDCV